jgi:hypothetical protein
MRQGYYEDSSTTVLWPGAGRCSSRPCGHSRSLDRTRPRYIVDRRAERVSPHNGKWDRSRDPSATAEADLVWLVNLVSSLVLVAAGTRPRYFLQTDSRRSTPHRYAARTSSQALFRPDGRSLMSHRYVCMGANARGPRRSMGRDLPSTARVPRALGRRVRHVMCPPTWLFNRLLS